MLRDPWGPIRYVLAATVLANTACATGTGTVVTFPASWRFNALEAPVTAHRGMVVSTDELATRVGVNVLRAGGNAVDAAIAVHFSLAVVNLSLIHI